MLSSGSFPRAWGNHKWWWWWWLKVSFLYSMESTTINSSGLLMFWIQSAFSPTFTLYSATCPIGCYLVYMLLCHKIQLNEYISHLGCRLTVVRLVFLTLRHKPYFVFFPNIFSSFSNIYTLLNHLLGWLHHLYNVKYTV